MALDVTDTVSIPEEEIEKRFTTAGGPGGQNVNKVATRVELRWNLDRTAVVPAFALQRLRTLERGRITKDGDLRIVCQVHREQARNLAEARERLREAVRRALVRPKARVETRPTRASKARRLIEKRQRGDLKRGRGRVSPDD